MNEWVGWLAGWNTLEMEMQMECRGHGAMFPSSHHLPMALCDFPHPTTMSTPTTTATATLMMDMQDTTHIELILISTVDPRL
mmetsp:Transcript_13636/g.37533  ORF Transcript_13636/g.37533 Transcript_13636/m.37533 type:complete len:82 (+) Transcript_13636:98-343(+)